MSHINIIRLMIAVVVAEVSAIQFAVKTLCEIFLFVGVVVLGCVLSTWTGGFPATTCIVISKILAGSL